MADTWKTVRNLWDTFGNNPDNQRTVDAMKGMFGLLPAGAGDVAAGLLAADDVRRGDYTSAALNGIGVLPFIPSMAGMLKGKGDDIAKAIKPTKYEQAHEVARQNAVKMLGLPENNTAMDRAKALGYTTPTYHGTGEDLSVIDNSKVVRNAYGQGLHSAASPLLANRFADHSKEGQNVLPLLIKVDNPATKQDYKDEMWRVWEKNGQHNATEIADNLKGKGFDTVKYNHGDFYYPNDEGKLTASLPDEDLSFASLNPNYVRSRFAAFDPARINEPDLLGRVNPELLPWLTGAGLLGAGGMYYSGE